MLSPRGGSQPIRAGVGTRVFCNQDFHFPIQSKGHSRQTALWLLPDQSRVHQIIQQLVSERVLDPVRWPPPQREQPLLQQPPGSARSVWQRQRPQPRKRSKPRRPQQPQPGRPLPRPPLCVESSGMSSHLRRRSRTRICARSRAIAAVHFGGARTGCAGSRGRRIRIAVADVAAGAARR